MAMANYRTQHMQSLPRNGQIRRKFQFRSLAPPSSVSMSHSVNNGGGGQLGRKYDDGIDGTESDDLSTAMRANPNPLKHQSSGAMRSVRRKITMRSAVPASFAERGFGRPRGNMMGAYQHQNQHQHQLYRSHVPPRYNHGQDPDPDPSTSTTNPSSEAAVLNSEVEDGRRRMTSTYPSDSSAPREFNALQFRSRGATSHASSTHGGPASRNRPFSSKSSRVHGLAHTRYGRSGSMAATTTAVSGAASGAAPHGSSNHHLAAARWGTIGNGNARPTPLVKEIMHTFHRYTPIFGKTLLDTPYHSNAHAWNPDENKSDKLHSTNDSMEDGDDDGVDENNTNENSFIPRGTPLRLSSNQYVEINPSNGKQLIFMETMTVDSTTGQVGTKDILVCSSDQDGENVVRYVVFSELPFTNLI